MVRSPVVQNRSLRWHKASGGVSAGSRPMRVPRAARCDLMRGLLIGQRTYVSLTGVAKSLSCC